MENKTKSRKWLYIVGAVLVVGITAVFAAPNLSGELFQGRLFAIKTIFLEKVKPVEPSRHIKAPPILMQHNSQLEFEATTLPIADFKSDFFQENLSVLMVPYDLSSDQLYSTTTSRSTSYKILSSLYMLGYTYDDRNQSDLGMYVLNKFQRNNSFEQSNILTAEVAREIDRQLDLYEMKFAGYADKYSVIFDNLHPSIKANIIQDDFSAWLSLGILEEVLPPIYQMETPEEMIYCLSGQCTGNVIDFNGNALDRIIDPYSDYYIDPIASPMVQYTTFVNPTASQAHTNIHEYAHYLDARGYESGNDPSIPHHNMIDTQEFYAISFDHDDYVTATFGTGSYGTCYRLKNNEYGFISYYGFDGNPHREDECPEGYSNGAAEDFAQSFSFYVTAGRNFREAASKNIYIEQKYNWIKDNIFFGIEYDTELPNVGYLYTGCRDGISEDYTAAPGYISCNDDFVWDGTFPKYYVRDNEIHWIVQ
jgi:hypothetical protein